MIRARKNKKAPTVIPVVRATSGEGLEPTHSHEEIQMIETIALDTDSAAEELSEPTLSERKFDAKAAEKGWVPGSPLWQLERRRHYYYNADTCESVELRAGARPIWSSPDHDLPMPHANGGFVLSRPWTMRLDLHPGLLRDNVRTYPTAQIQLAQKASEVDPFVILDRFTGGEKPSEGIARVAGTEFKFTLDEAAELAHLLLLVVDVARGTSDDIDQQVA